MTARKSKARTKSKTKATAKPKGKTKARAKPQAKPKATSETRAKLRTAAKSWTTQISAQAASPTEATAGAQTFEIGGQQIASGSRMHVDMDFVRLPAQARLSLPTDIVVGARLTDDSPRLWLSGAIHGDELNGMEIIHRSLELIDPLKVTGVVIGVPIVNIFGFAIQSRYLPDRRDLNRSFPGSARGSLAGRLAHFFLTEIVSKSTHGIDLHTGSNNRVNLPQVRADLDDPETLRLATAFAAPVLLHGDSPPGSLRRTVAALGKPIMVYETGEPLRFDEAGIALGVRGVLNVMVVLGMLETLPDGAPDVEVPTPRNQPALAANLEVRRRTWVRAPLSGIFRIKASLGETVVKGAILGELHEPLGGAFTPVRAPRAGVVIGLTNNPLAYQGDALVHLGHPEGTDPAENVEVRDPSVDSSD